MNAIQMTAKMYDARDAMRSLYGDRYAEKVRPLIPQLHQLADKWNLSLVQSMLRASQEMTARGDNGIGTALLIAAYVEDVEGTFHD